jgi:hypothetical protein
MEYIFRTLIVGDDLASAVQLKMCIDDWISSGAAATQSFTVGGTILMVSVILMLLACSIMLLP